MHEHQPHVNEIERRLRQRIRHDVVTADLQVRNRQRLEESCVEIRRHRAAVRQHAVREPTRDRATSAANFEAVPPRPHAPAQ